MAWGGMGVGGGIASIAKSKECSTCVFHIKRSYPRESSALHLDRVINIFLLLNYVTYLFPGALFILNGWKLFWDFGYHLVTSGPEDFQI